ncbi:DUF3552 domain-containing protein [Candidatus Peregrinibacteria bacterium]|nr:DUF3552 domain-containing protein [Candidatus Peregrinibacteria bacterium]
MSLIDILILAGAIILGALISQVIFRKIKFVDIEKTRAKSEELMHQAKTEAEHILADAKANAQSIKTNTEDMLKQMKTLINTIEQNIRFKEEALRRKDTKNSGYKEFVALIEEDIKKTDAAKTERENQLKEKLAAKLGLRLEDMSQNFIDKFTHELEQEKDEKLAKLQENLKEQVEKKAKNILKDSMQKFTDRTSVEKKEAVVIVRRDEIKAEIVGRNAENILLFEKLIDVDVVFNDEPNTIVVSCYDLLRKTIARIALEKLVKMRHITTRNISEAIDQAKRIIDADLMLVGEKALHKMGFKKQFPRDFIKIVGRLKYRTSYGQNILLHSFEVAYMAELLASELGLDVETAKIGAFFHDIGKAIDHEVEGSHDVLTREIMTKYNFTSEQIHAAWTHHEAETPNTPEARIVMAADAISAGRPGARQESLGKYLDRLRALEEIATEFKGVQKTYAISAGREVRVLVIPEEVPDEKMSELAGSIAHEIEEHLSYPGKIKVNLIRRTKAVDAAK